MTECLVSEDGLHSAIIAPEWEDDDLDLETGGIICKWCGEVLE